VLALVVWEATFVLHGIRGQGQLSEIAATTVASNVPVWGLLVPSAHSNRVRLARAIEAGAAGILHKSSLLEGDRGRPACALGSIRILS
jgi:hypothetical protein